MDKKTRLVEWSESFHTLPEDYFFELMRMYLGEIKTPYNKTKLVEQLGSFIRGEKAKKNLVSLLTEKDVQVMSAIKLLPESTPEQLLSFFSHEYALSEFYEIISSLEERLLIYTISSSRFGKQVIDITPILDEVLDPYLGVDVLLRESPTKKTYEQKQSLLTQQFMASFVSFAFAHKDLCKNNGSFKKRALAELTEIYGEEKIPMLELLTKAFTNLGIFYEEESYTRVDFSKLNEFAALSPLEQNVYVCVAGAAKLTRRNLASSASLFLETLSSIPGDGYSRQTVFRLSQLLKGQQRNVEAAPISRLSRIFAENSGVSELSDSGLMDLCIENACECGLLYVSANAQNGQELYRLSKFEEESSNKKVLNLDSGFSITIMPGLSLVELLPLMKFMQPKRFDTAALFEISRQSVMQAFDYGVKPQDVFAALDKYSLFEFPQNIKINVEEWYATYSSASLYHGYILKVSSENAALTQKNPVLSKHIVEELAPGIFLLDFKNDDEQREVISKSGLDFLGRTKTATDEFAVQPFQRLRISSQKKDIDSSRAELCSPESQKQILDELMALLENIEASPDQKEGLKERIQRRIIVDATQLRAESVHFDLLEAYGTDYSGKLHVIESAISTASMIEMETTEGEGILLGFPISLNKKSVNGEFTICLEGSENVKLFHTSAIIRVKKLRSRITLNPRNRI